MTPATSPPTAPPDVPVRAALGDPALRAELVRHAVARLGVLLADRPWTVRVEAAEDAVQEALNRAVERQATFDPNAGTTAAGWVHGILNNVLSEHCRKLRKQPAQPPADPTAWENLVADMDTTSVPAALDELLARLPEASRQIIVWHHVDGRTHRDIAAVRGISEANARTRLCRALTDLKRIAAELEGGR